MTVVYEDNHIIVVNKTASEIVQADKTGDTPLSETVKQYLKEKYQKPGNLRHEGRRLRPHGCRPRRRQGQGGGRCPHGRCEPAHGDVDQRCARRAHQHHRLRGYGPGGCRDRCA